MAFPNLAAINAPSLVSSLPAQSLTELQVALARTGYPVKTIDGLYGPNTSSCWAGFCAETLPGNPDLITPAAANGLLNKIDVLAEIEVGPQGTQDQVITAIIAECNAMGLALRTQHAYIVATTYWESAHTFRPVREAFYLPDPESYLRAKPYYPYYGRGYVQLTWQDNYEHYGRILQSDLVGNPDRALEPAIALFVLVQGFKLGAFTGHKITDYINAGGTDFMKARLCINGTDRVAEIATIAQNYMASLPP
jgi:predicted chitinase